MKKSFSFFFLLLAFGNIQAQRYFPNSYYVTLAGDTVKTTVVYTNIVDAQRLLTVKDGNNAVKTFSPGEIKGFGITTNGDLKLLAWQKTETDISEITEITPYSLYSGSTESAWVRDTKPSTVFFKSLKLSDKKQLFSVIRSGNQEPLEHLSYFYAESTGDTAFKSIALLIKDNQLVNWSKKNVHLVFANAVSDYTLLAKMVKKSKLDVWNVLRRPSYINVDLVVQEYSAWRKRPENHKMDTSLTLKGIIDANRHYHAGKAFWGAALPACVLVFPGLIVANAALDHPPTEKSLKIPKDCAPCKNTSYTDAYKMRARYKRERSIQRGLLVGGAVGVLSLFALLIALNSK